MTYLILSHNTRYLTDVNTMMALNDYDFEIEMSTSVDKVADVIAKTTPAAIFVTNDIVAECKNLTSYKIFGIDINKNSSDAFDGTGIKCLGLFRSASSFLDFLATFDADGSSSPAQAPEPKPETKPESEEIPTAIAEPVIEEAHVTAAPEKEAETNTAEPFPENVPEEDIMDAHMDAEISKAEEQVMLDLKLDNSKTKVITIYSAKGGVGKTTIACELAAFLSATCRDRRKARVCIIDYNIDFGDVRQTLGFSDNGMNMAFWANEINARIDSGEDIADITYNQSEIETYLQKVSIGKNDIYGLIAPINHEDSMVIGQQGALSVMLKSIIANGDFDYVVCDTGNNTRDATVLAIQAATLLVIIYTQDINNYYCNASFIDTMTRMGLIDPEKDNIKMVVNKAKSERYTSLSVAEIEKYTMFDCIAKIKDTSELVKANNKSEPLVLTNFAPEFNKEIQKIASHCTDEEISPAKKSGLLERLFKRKKDDE